MLRDQISLTMPVTCEARATLTSSWQSVGLHDNVLLFSSLLLLVLSTIDHGPFGSFCALCWLVSFAALVFVNIGAALAAYISSLAIYSPLHFAGWASLSQRPDNYAVVILFIAILRLAITRQEARPRFFVYLIPAFLAFSILHGVILSPTQVVTIFRDLVIPLLACLFLAMIGFRKRELNALLNGMAAFGAYTGLVSILERFHEASWILPPWIGDPSLRAPDPWLDGWIGSGQAGGTLLYPAFNGLFLSLICIMLYLRLREGRSILITSAMLLCIAGAFLTYERGVWLGLIISLLCFPGWCGSLRQAHVRRVALAWAAVVLLILAGAMAKERLQDTETILYRLALWGAGLRIFWAHPLFGVGFFNFGAAATGTAQGFGVRILSFREIADGAASHNTPLTVLVEFGIVGFLFYATVFFKIVRTAMSNAAKLWGRPAATWVLAFVIVYLVNAQVISAFEGTTNTAFFALLGVIAGTRKEAV